MRIKLAILSIAAFGILAPAQARAEMNVLVTIKPIHALVASVMRGVTPPEVLLAGNESPHTYQMRPSDARKLRTADIIFRVSPDLETFLNKPIASLAKKAELVTLADAPGLTLLPARKGGAFEPEVDETTGHGHESENDMHIWLDPENARAMVDMIVKTLSEHDPKHTQLYARNGRSTLSIINAVNHEMNMKLYAVKNRPFIVFHDAYQYFEKRYGLTAAGSITVAPDRLPGAQRLDELRGKIVQSKTVCVFSEPQFPSTFVKTIVQGTKAKTGILDPLGTSLDPGPEEWKNVMEGLANNLVNCLTPPEPQNTEKTP